ncbi:MAG: flavin reductase [Pseudomonadales bacterium]|nr:flavin reductase [Pseudomonadales bacterium]
MQRFTSDAISKMEKGYRVNFVNSLSGFKSSNLIGTADAEGNTNLAVFSSAVHLGADPALIGLVSRPRSVERHSIENILATGYYTINHVNRHIVKEAHQTAARYTREQCEFNESGLTPEFKGDFHAPFVSESKLCIAMKLVEAKHIEINNTEFIIGEIQDVFIGRDAIRDDGYVDIEQLGTVAASGLDSYHVTQRIGRLTYAKPDREPKWLLEDDR